MVKVYNFFATVSQRMGNWKRLKNKAARPTTSLNGLHKCLHALWNVKKACGMNWQRWENFLKNDQIWQLFDHFSKKMTKKWQTEEGSKKWPKNAKSGLSFFTSKIKWQMTSKYDQFLVFVIKNDNLDTLYRPSS